MSTNPDPTADVMPPALTQQFLRYLHQQPPPLWSIHMQKEFDNAFLKMAGQEGGTKQSPEKFGSMVRAMMAMAKLQKAKEISLEHIEVSSQLIGLHPYSL
jgi:hypothetical protein